CLKLAAHFAGSAIYYEALHKVGAASRNHGCYVNGSLRLLFFAFRLEIRRDGKDFRRSFSSRGRFHVPLLSPNPSQEFKYSSVTLRIVISRRDTSRKNGSGGMQLSGASTPRCRIVSSPIICATIDGGTPVSSAPQETFHSL